MLIPPSSPPAPAEGPLLVVSVSGSKVSVDALDGPAPRPSSALFVGTVGDRQCWAVDTDEEADGRRFVDLMSLYPRVDESTWAAAGRAVQLVAWARNHRYCGHCGTPTEQSEHERARRCPACGLLAFPRLAPAVITLVEREDGRVLLARNAGWPSGMYSCLAGFVEPGETVEDALRREVYEEVGVHVGALRYFASQPWPFPHSLMLGFHADYAGGEIVCDGEEIADAAWFGRDELPAIPGRISIARKLIDDWAARPPR